jgi:hypothetical protein
MKESRLKNSQLNSLLTTKKPLSNLKLEAVKQMDLLEMVSDQVTIRNLKKIRIRTFSRPSANIAVEKAKPVKEVKQVNDHPWGYNPGAHPAKKELDTSYMKQK